MPKRPGNEVGCSKIPLALEKLIIYFSNPPALLRKIPDGTYKTSPISPISHISPNHDAPKGDFHSSSWRRLPPGMMPFGERPQIPIGARDHDSAAVVVNEEVVVVRPFARKIYHHLG